jgi:hypothetical protein
MDPTHRHWDVGICSPFMNGGELFNLSGFLALRWEKAVGDSVSVDEVLCEIETDKTSVPVSSWPIIISSPTHMNVTIFNAAPVHSASDPHYSDAVFNIFFHGNTAHFQMFIKPEVLKCESSFRRPHKVSCTEHKSAVKRKDQTVLSDLHYSRKINDRLLFSIEF